MIGNPPTPYLSLLPERDTMLGPVARRRVARLWIGYAILFVAGLSLSQFASRPSGQAFGLGLMLPGGGFLAHAGTSGLGIAHIHVV